MIATKFTIVCRGITDDALENAFDEAIERLRQGNTAGSDSNDTSGFYFRVEEATPAEVPA